MYKNTFYKESKFGGFTDVDGTIAFYNRINSLIESDYIMLNVGCGRGAFGEEDPLKIRRELQIFKGKVKTVIGIDVDKNAEKNPFIDEFRLIKNNVWPVEDNSIDIIICDCVLEHIENPEEFFKETQRVLKNNAYLCFRTPNYLSYFGLISKLIPNRAQFKVKEILQKTKRAEKDVFLTYYRCNTISQINKMFNKYGFDGIAYGYNSEPAYFSFSKFIYGLGVLIHKIIPDKFACALFSFARLKKEE